jgi:protein-arginine kinase activator protein McsA
MEKRCAKCGTSEALHKGSSYTRKSGEKVQLYICRPCNNARIRFYRHEHNGMQKQYEASQRYLAKHPGRTKLYQQCHKIPMKPCESCGSTKTVDRHHDDYRKPLEIRFLCRLCHKKHHQQLLWARQQRSIYRRVASTKKHT